MFKEFLVFGLGTATFGLKHAARITGNPTYLVAAVGCLVGVYQLGVRQWSQGTIAAMGLATVAGASLPDDLIIALLGVAS